MNTRTGSYKTVYLVSSINSNKNVIKYAFSIEKLHTSSDVKDAFNSILIPQSLQT